MRLAALTTATLGLLLALAAPARADGNVGVVVTGESWMQSQLAAQITAWLSQHGHTPVESAMAPDAINALNDCVVTVDQGCARGVVEKAAGAPSVLYARVDARSNGSGAPDLTLTAYWFDKGHDAIEKTTCPRCTDQTLRTAADQILQKLIGGGELGHVTLKSAPPGARITIDGTAIGVTPLDWDLPPGKHTIQMDKRGRKSAVRDHVVVSNKTDLLVMTMPPEDERIEQQPSRTVPLALVIGGGAAIVAGAGLIAFSPGPDPDQRFYRRTWPPGIAVAAGGAVVAGVGAYLLWFRSPQTTSTPVASVSSDGAYVGWLGRF
ncbi:MAG TPA: PEGA domain-containing protein [Kofleriaceae bacterium]|jgi:hypothetical protein|nr:PEGA domain-containing protein [Kofleriaceae bacterium]